MTLPPHLSPFTKEGDYEPERLIQLKELKGETSTGQNTSSLPLCFLVQESLTARKPREGMPTLEKERSWSNYFGYWLD